MPKRGQEINLVGEISGKIIHNWYWFVLSVILFVGIGRIYLRYQTPVYKIESRFLIKKQVSPGAQGEMLSQLNGGENNDDVLNEIEVLKTAFMMKRVVRDLQLNVSIFSKGNIKSTELYKTAPFSLRLLQLRDSVGVESWKVRLDPQSHLLVLSGAEGVIQVHWGDTVRSKNTLFIIERNGRDFPAGDEYFLLIRPEDQPASGYLDAIKIAPVDEGMNIVRMTIADPLPQRGMDVLNDLYDVYVKANVEDQNILADSTITFINNRLAIVSGELSGVEKNVEQFKSTNGLVDIGQQAQIVTTNTNDLQKQNNQQDVQLELLDAIENQLDGKDFRVVPTALQAQSAGYSSLVERFNGLILERDAQLETSRPANPIIQQLNNEIERVRNDLRTELKNIRSQMMVSKGDLARRISQSMGTIKSIPFKQRAFLDISRQQEVKQQLYLFLLQKREETAISKSGTLSNSRLIDPARADMAPFSPNRQSIYLSCLVAGLLLPSAVIYLRELLNNKIGERKDIMTQTDVPIIGEIGHNKTGDALVVTNDSRSIIAEQFRAVRTNLRYLLTGKQHQVILVTSSMSGEGKSFVSLNLGASLALSGKKVVLLELDLRKPRLSNELDLANEQGFTNFIISNADLKYLPKLVRNQPNLYVINSGPIPPNPSELLLQDKVKVLFEYLYVNFDYVIIDTPPVGLVTDALLLAQFADTCLYVARQNYTFKEQISIVEDLHTGNKMKGLSVIINDVDGKRGKGYGYGYGYGKGSYYTDEPGRKSIWHRLFLKK